MSQGAGAGTVPSTSPRRDWMGPVTVLAVAVAWAWLRRFRREAVLVAVTTAASATGRR